MSSEKEDGKVLATMAASKPQGIKKNKAVRLDQVAIYLNAERLHVVSKAR